MLGGGLMGRPMALRLKSCGYDLRLYNRTSRKVEDLRREGIEVAGHPMLAIEAARAVILMLADAPAIHAVLDLLDGSSIFTGKTVIQMGTIGPEESRACERRIAALGGDYLEAPVLGSLTEAKEGRLLVMVGARPEQFGEWQGLLACLGPQPRHVGTVGQAALVKLALNQLIASHIAALSLSLGLIQRSGIPVDSFMAPLRESALFAPMYDKKLPRLLDRRYDHPNFSARHLLKDIDLCRETAASLNVQTGGLDGVRVLVAETVRQGWGEADYSALFEVISPPRQEK
jgi:3-hydroxyisobutyrate dehydrogenase